MEFGEFIKDETNYKVKRSVGKVGQERANSRSIRIGSKVMF